MVKRDFIRNILLLLIVIIGAILLRIFVFSTFKVTPATANAYLKNGDLITIKKNIQPKYKDFVVYRVDKKDYVSRVVAVEEIVSPIWMIFFTSIIWWNHKPILKR